MSVETTGTSVRHTVDVAAPIEHVFRVFTEQMTSWWDPTHHLIDNVDMVVERRVGGTITDVGADGTTCTWSRVLAYEPPTLFASRRNGRSRPTRRSAARSTWGSSR